MIKWISIPFSGINPKLSKSSIPAIFPLISILVNPADFKIFKVSLKELISYLKEALKRNVFPLFFLMKSITSDTLSFFTSSPEMGEKVRPILAKSNFK